MKETIMEQKAISTDVLVVGAGISGMSTALETAETGFTVTLLEKEAFVGGRVAQLNQYFPKFCPPTCGLEINIKRIKDNKNINLLTLAEIIDISGKEGSYKVKIKVKPRYIKESTVDIDDLIQNLSIEKSNEFNFGMNKSKVIYRPYNNSYPEGYYFDKNACTEDEVKFIADNYSQIIDMNQKEEIIELETKAIVWATGWEPYDANKLETLGYSKYKNVVTNMELERLAAASGPTGGKIDIEGKEINSVAFVQCAGSRDENHLEYCSSICCLASLKHAKYIREQYPESDIYVFYIDIRSPGVFEEVYTNAKKDEKLYFHRGKVAKVIENPETGKLIVEAEDTLTGQLNQAEVDLVVLATGMKPRTNIPQIDKKLLDRNGFIHADLETGQFGCGVCTKPKDVAGVVQEATAAAIKAIHTIRGNNNG